MTADPVGRYLAAASQQAKAWLGAGCKRAEIAAGPVGLAEIKRFSRFAPGALAACLALDPVAASDAAPQGLVLECEARARIGVFLIDTGPRRDASAREMASAVAAGAAGVNWTQILKAEIDGPNGTVPADPDAACAFRAESVRADNLFSGALADETIGLWGVHWTIDICIPVPGAAAPPAVPVPRELYAGWDPNTGSEHLGDYERLDEEAA